MNSVGNQEIFLFLQVDGIQANPDFFNTPRMPFFLIQILLYLKGTSFESVINSLNYFIVFCDIL